MMGPGWRGWLASPRAPVAFALIALVLASPSLVAGLATEDFALRANAARPLSESVNLYSALRTAVDVQAGQRDGLLPWLTSPELRISFFRPVSSLWTVFDYRVLGDAVWLMHVESIVLFASLVGLVATLLRRIVPEAWLAGLAGLIYAVDDVHGHAVGWLANRNAVLAAAFGFGALLSHDRWRRDGSRVHAWLAPALLGLCLGSSELGLAALAYFVTYTLFLDGGPRRWLALLPALSVVVGWALLYRALGYGSSGSGIYLDPIGAPLTFASALPSRMGALLLGQLGYPPSDAWVGLGDGSQLWLALPGAAAFGALVVATRSAGRSRGALRFGLAGMLLSLVPAAATAPSDRTLLFAGLGAAIGLATLISLALERASLALKTLALSAAVLHLIAAPALLPWRSLTMKRFHDHALAASASAYANVTSGDDLVVAFGAPDYYFCSLMRALHHLAVRRPAPAMVCLYAGRGSVEIARVDDNALSLRAPAGYLEEPFNRIFRSRASPLRAGDRVYIGTLEALVTESTPAGEPVAVTFRFNWPLASERLRFVDWNGTSFVPTTPPRAGERRVLEPTR